MVVNDQRTTVLADDSTNVGGNTRITIPSLSGCGRIAVQVYVSGVLRGSKNAIIRTTDTNADGHTTSNDLNFACDVSFDGAPSDTDVALVGAHSDHSHRNALHGTLVRRTNLCETCPEDAANTIGDSQDFWSPSSRFIAYTRFVFRTFGADTDVACNVFIVPSDPNEGDGSTQFTNPPFKYHDYDPSWSPMNDVIVFDRGDSVLVKKAVPWTGGSSEVPISASSNFGCGQKHGDDIPAISPDGKWVAFSRCNPQLPEGPGGWSLWKVPIAGGAASQLTPTTSATDFYASWAPDGQTIYFQRKDEAVTPGWTLWKVPADGGTAEQVFASSESPDVFDAVQPALSPDGGILLTGYGKRSDVVRNVAAHTLDPTLSSPTPAKFVPNYVDTTFAAKSKDPILSPRLSPDGTRLLLKSKQLWAARCNMNLPPQFSSAVNAIGDWVQTQAIPDTAATAIFKAVAGVNSAITLSAIDPESDGLTYKASFLRPWMQWLPDLQTLIVVAPDSVIGQIFNVKFWVTTPSGGMDALIGLIKIDNHVESSVKKAADNTDAIASQGAVPPSIVIEGPNPTRATFSISTSARLGVTARLSIFDIAGRCVTRIDCPAGKKLVWPTVDHSGTPVPSGIYPYRIEVGSEREDGRVVVFR